MSQNHSARKHGQTVSRAEVRTISGKSDQEINEAVRKGELPPPNIVNGFERWWRDEVVAFSHSGRRVHWLTRA